MFGSVWGSVLSVEWCSVKWCVEWYVPVSVFSRNMSVCEMMCGVVCGEVCVGVCR